MRAERLILVLLAVLVVILAAAVLWQRGRIVAEDRSGMLLGQPHQAPGSSASVRAEVPVTVEASTNGPHERWVLSVEPSGQAHLWDRFESGVTFQIPPEDWGGFRKALERERFFDLKGAYGEHISFGHSERLTVTAGSVTHTSVLLYTTDLPDPALSEADRADRLFQIVRGWVHEARNDDPFRRTLLDHLKGGSFEAAVKYLATVNPAEQVRADIERGRAGLMGVYGITLLFPGTDNDYRLRDKPWWAMPGTSDAIESEAHSAWMSAAWAFAEAYNAELRKHRPDLFIPRPATQPSRESPD